MNSKHNEDPAKTIFVSFQNNIAEVPGLRHYLITDGLIDLFGYSLLFY